MHTADPWHALLLDAHAARPGMTSRGFGPFRTDDGKSSYELLSDRVVAMRLRRNEPLAILDAGCGDGFLARRILDDVPDAKRFVGVDMSSAELALAHQRLAASIAELRLERADAIGLESESIDVVVSHMALMLFQPLEAAVRELARVLRPGGRLFAVISALNSVPTTEARYRAILAEAMQATPGQDALLARVPVFRTCADATQVLGDNGFSAIEIQTFTTHRTMSPDDVFDHFADYYLVSVQPPEVLAEARTAVTRAARADAARADDKTRLSIALSLVSARRA